MMSRLAVLRRVTVVAAKERAGAVSEVAGRGAVTPAKARLGVGTGTMRLTQLRDCIEAGTAVARQQPARCQWEIQFVRNLTWTWR
jgi:hypothetical protein